MMQEKRVAASLYLWFYVTFVCWYHLPRQGSLLPSQLETWPLGGLSLWGDLLSPFWVRPCFFVLCMAGLTGFFWALLPRSSLASLTPGLTALLGFKLALMAADLRLVAPAQLAHAVLTAAFLLGRLPVVRLATLALALGALLQSPVPLYGVAFAASLLWLAPGPRVRDAGVWLYLAIQALIWLWRGLTAPVSFASFEDSGFLLVTSALALVPLTEPVWRGVRLGWLVLLVAFLPAAESPTSPKILARYTLDDGEWRCVLVATMPARTSWTDRPEVDVQAQVFQNGRLVKDVRSLNTPVTLGDRVVFNPGRFELASPETMADPRFHDDYARRTGATVELFVGGPDGDMHAR